jgi:hypothetical protein
MKFVQVRNELHSTYGAAEEKIQRSRGRTELGPRDEESRSSSTIKLRGGRRDAVVGVEENTIPPSAASRCRVVRCGG